MTEGERIAEIEKKLATLSDAVRDEDRWQILISAVVGVLFGVVCWMLFDGG